MAGSSVGQPVSGVIVWVVGLEHCWYQRGSWGEGGSGGGSAAISHCLLTSGGLRPAVCVWGPPDRP